MSVPTISADGVAPVAATPPGTPPDAAAPSWAWSALLVTGAIWLALCWTVLRVQPTNISWWAGAAVLFGAVSEALRAVSGTRLWWLHAGLTALFAMTGAVIMIDQDATLTTPAALVGWYLMVRGAVDLCTAVVSRATEATWGLVLAIGMVETGLGFWASSSFARTADVVIVLVGALALTRGLVDLTGSLDAWAATVRAWPAPARRAEQSAGEVGYLAGMADFAAATTTATPRPGRARHRAAGTAGTLVARPTPGVQVTTTDLDAAFALAGMGGATAAAEPGLAGPADVRAATMFTGPDVIFDDDSARPEGHSTPA